MGKIDQYRRDVYRVIQTIDQPFNAGDVLEQLDWKNLCIESQQAAVREVMREMAFVGIIAFSSGHATNKSYCRQNFTATHIPNPYLSALS